MASRSKRIGVLEIELDYIVKLIAHMHIEASTKFVQVGPTRSKSIFLDRWLPHTGVAVLFSSLNWSARDMQRTLVFGTVQNALFLQSGTLKWCKSSFSPLRGGVTARWHGATTLAHVLKVAFFTIVSPANTPQAIIAVFPECFQWVGVSVWNAFQSCDVLHIL